MPLHTFQFTGQAHGGVVPLGHALLVLDTNVVSALDGVAKRGFDLERLSDRRVAHMLRWLEARPDVDVFPLFGIIEGAGFHQGGLSSYSLVQRAFVALAAVGYGRQHPDDWIRSGERLPDLLVPDQAVHPREAVNAAEALLPWTVLPCYVAALAAALAAQEGREALEAAGFVHRRLVTELDFVPIFGWLTAALLFLGQTSLRRELRQALFKLQRPDVRTSCLSAAWDLGYLQLLSIARSPTLDPLFGRRLPILVTEDRQLAPTSILALCVGNTPAFEVRSEMFDARWRDEALDLLQQCQAERLQVRGRPPDWDACASAAGRLERELGIEDAPALSVRGPTITIDVSGKQLLAFLALLRVHDASALVTELLRLEEDVEAAGLVAVSRLIEDNARARGHSVEASWDALGGRLPVGWQQSSTLVLTLKTVRAVAHSDWQLATAWRHRLALDAMDGFVSLWLWSIGRDVLADTAIARNEPADELLSRLIGRVKSASRSEGLG
jgi:hypothetical protein